MGDSPNKSASLGQVAYCAHRPAYSGRNLRAARACALAISFSRVRGSAVVSSERRRFREVAAISSTAARKAASLTFDGLLNPLTFLTNCSAASRISSSVAGGSRLNSGFIFLHTGLPPFAVVQVGRIMPPVDRKVNPGDSGFRYAAPGSAHGSACPAMSVGKTHCSRFSRFNLFSGAVNR